MHSYAGYIAFSRNNSSKKFCVRVSGTAMFSKNGLRLNPTLLANSGLSQDDAFKVSCLEEGEVVLEKKPNALGFQQYFAYRPTSPRKIGWRGALAVRRQPSWTMRGRARGVGTKKGPEGPLCVDGVLSRTRTCRSGRTRPSRSCCRCFQPGGPWNGPKCSAGTNHAPSRSP
jgi:hypothetical protein